jgi:NAD-dependent SIR2 family protein deacetylase
MAMAMAIATTTTVATKTDNKAKKPRGTKKRKHQNPLVFPPYPLLCNNNNDNDKNDENYFLESVANLLVGKKNIVVLVGAGISTSVGIPDFRSKDKGLYNTLDAGALGLSCPEDLFCIEFFKSNPLPFYKFAKHLYYPNQEEDATSTSTATATARGGKQQHKNKNDSSSNNNNKKSKGATGTKERKPLPETRTSTRTSQRIRQSRRTMHEEEREPALDVVDGERETSTLQKPQQPASSSGATVTHQAGTASPSDSHKLLALLEKRKMLLRVYTQNIDGLESSAGVSDSKIVYCHGSLRSMSCTKCSKKNLPLDKAILESIESGSVPFCKVAVPSRAAKTKTSSSKLPKSEAATGAVVLQTRTSKRTKRSRSAMEGDNHDDEHEHNSGHGERNNNGHNNNNNNCYNYTTPDGTVVPCCGGVLKPGITFFGETLDNSVGRKIESDQSKADALIVIGTSLSVAPISRVIEYLPKNIPRILINQTIVHPKTNTTTSTRTAAAAINNDSCSQNEGDLPNDDREFRKNYVFDAYLLGFCDDVTRALGKQLGLGCNVEKKAKTPKTTTAREIKTKTKSKKPPPKMIAAVVVARHASDTGAKLLKGVVDNEAAQNLNLDNDDEREDPGWRGITVPRERVLLFPGALPTVVSAAMATNTGEATPTASYQTIAHCDGCSKLIPSGRPIFKCSRCFDYDLCQACYPRVSKLHCDGSHSFRKE